MTKSKTLHVVPDNGHWAVKREGRTPSIHPTQKAAIEHARSVVTKSKSGQFVVHKENGEILTHMSIGLPPIQQPPYKSRIEKRIEKVVSDLALSRMN